MSVPETCQCSKAGHCPVLNIVMSGRRYQICKGQALSQEKRAFYLKLWTRLPPVKAISSKPKAQAPVPEEIILAAEKAAEQTGMLLGDVLGQLTAAVGIPPCDRCKKRIAWINKAHLWTADFIKSRFNPA